ncbi:MAG: DNA recombination protein RmuC [Actinomycetes bacterium]
MTTSNLTFGALIISVATLILLSVVMNRLNRKTTDLSRDDYREIFRAATNEGLVAVRAALDDATESRLRTNTEHMSAQNSATTETIKATVAPISTTIAELKAKVDELEKARVGAYELLNEQVRNTGSMLTDLSVHTSALSNAMKSSTVRGRWGEVQLERIVTMMGMSERVDFDKQIQQQGEGRGRPDATVHLPDGRVLYIDSKFPASKYLDALEATDPEAQKVLLKEHTDAMIGHIQELVKRDYVGDARALDYVVMFVPLEPALSAAFNVRPDLIEYAAERKVVLASPTSLIAILNNFAQLWQAEDRDRNSEQILKHALELQSRLTKFVEYLASIGTNLDKSVSSYNEAIGSFDQRIMPEIRRIEDLGKVSKIAPNTSPVDSTTRTSRYEGETQNLTEDRSESRTGPTHLFEESDTNDGHVA